MVYPGYILKPGDLFQVDPDHVLLGTGMQKRKSTQPKEGSDDAPAKAKPAKTQTEKLPYPVKGFSVKMAGIVTDKLKETIAACENAKKPHNELVKLSQFVHNYNRKRLRVPSPKETALSVCLADMMQRLAIAEKTRSTITQPADTDAPKLTQEETRKWDRLVENIKLNDVDPNKPYATPWRPRPFMQAFAFIPRYLEVNQNICAAVYLRHPVCRPGFAEVPTPFSPEISQLAHSWYLRRG